MRTDPETTTAEATLDPGDWETIRAVAHRSLDAMIDHVRSVRERPVWRPVPAEVRERLATDPPWEGEGLEAVAADVHEIVAPYALGNVHPRFWGWVPGSGTVGGIVAELLKAGLNSVPSAFDEVGLLLERRVIAWMLEAFGMPAGGSGVLVSGGSVANYVGLAVARDARVGFDVRDLGMGAAPEMPVVYASIETHNSVDKAIQLLGIGRRNLRKIPVDERFEIDVDALRAAIAADRDRGLAPIAIVGNVGTVNTAAIDDLNALADVAAKEGLWLHVDGAFGAIARLSPELADRLAGIERVDSLAFDFHKWMHVQYEVGCTLFRDRAAHRAAFTVPASYLSPFDRGPAAQPDPAHQLAPELSREAKALKVWMSIREHGLATFGRLVHQNVEQARYLAELVAAEPRLELLAPVSLNIVCFRFVPEAAEGWEAGELDDLNRELLMRLQERGIAVPSHTVLGGRFAIRTCITSHRTRREDVELLVREVVRLGGEVAAERAPAASR